MSKLEVGVAAEMANITAVVTRCGCPPGEMDHPGAACYRPRAIEDRGVIAYYHKNPIRRWLWAATHRRKS